MLKKFALWFICFGLSFLVSNVFGWTEQGKAFIFIYMGVSVVLFLAAAIRLLTLGANVSSSLVVLFTAIALAITLFATWGATKLFDVDFYVAYQLMTFGQCLCPDN